jgi:hypothetical protein
VRVGESNRAKHCAEVFGLKDGQVAFLSHCGSRGIGHNLAMGQFRALQSKFQKWNIPLPGNDKELVYAPLGSDEANAYIDDMSIGAKRFKKSCQGRLGIWSTSSVTISREKRYWITKSNGCIAKERLVRFLLDIQD